MTERDKQYNLLQFDSVQYSPLVNGNYHFLEIVPGNYILKVFADTANPNLTPTYSGNVWAWDSAMVIVHDCSTNDTLFIMMIEQTGTGGGIGVIHGQVIEGEGFGRAEGGPIPGVDVKLGRNPGGIVASIPTDNNGEYTFTGVANGNYSIYVDIPGLGRVSSYTVDVSTTNNQFLNLDYTADSTSIHVIPNAGVNDLSFAAENKFRVYPNPFKGNASIVFSLGKDAAVSLAVYTVQGTKIKTIMSGNQKAGDFKYTITDQNNLLSAGVYFLTLTIDGQAGTKRIIVME